MNTIIRNLVAVVVFTAAFSNSFAVSLPSIFGNHMVLQQNEEIQIWGWGKPLEEVVVTGSWDKREVRTVVDNKSQWKVVISTPAAGGPHSLEVRGYNVINIEDVLIGEVWLCSGQSNMEWTAAAGIDDAAEEIQTANFPEIRFFSVGHRTAVNPQIDLQGEWVVCTPETMKYFSAIGYFFGKEINSKMNTPVGLINSSWGGTPAEVWVDRKIIEDNEILSSAHENLKEMKWAPREPGYTYNAMIAPLIPFRIAGALWYQGETNTYSPETYSQLLAALIKSWRAEWGYDFPFYYVQIAPYNYGRPFEGVLLRDAQRKTMSVNNTGMVVISDIGNIDNIHPTNKKEVGRRLAVWALSRTYGFEELSYSGPLFREMKKEGDKIRIFFDYADNGLLCRDKSLSHFQIAGENQLFVDADAKIDGNAVVVSAKSVKNPVAVRFGWSNTAVPNLFNREGLPASCFRTDNWEFIFK